MITLNKVLGRLTKSSGKKKLFFPLYISILILVLSILGQQGFNLLIAHLNHEASDWVTHTLLVQREGEYLLNAVIDEERDFLEDNHNQLALNNDNEGNVVFEDSLNRLSKMVEDNPVELKQVIKIREIHNQWQSELNHQPDYSSSHSLKQEALFDSLYNSIGKLIQHEEMLSGDRKNYLEHLNHINIAINILTTIVILLGASLNFQLLHRRVKVPLHKLTEVSKLWQAGETEVQLRYSSGDEIGELATLLDTMAEETRYRQHSMEARNQHLEDMICALSHDLRTPLLATRSILNSMLKGAFGTVNETWREIFQEHRQANEDLLKLVEVLLDVSRYESNGNAHLNCDRLNWEKIFTKAIKQVKATSQCELTLVSKISDSLPTIYGDELEIQRVLQNLLDNAVRVSQPQAKILLEIIASGQNQVQVSVKDRGSGIAAQDQEKLFYRFIQGRSQRGRSGLGLYLCRQIIEAHGGRIGVKSSLGQGSTFWFTLPVPTNNADFNHQPNISKCRGNNERD